MSALSMSASVFSGKAVRSARLQVRVARVGLSATAAAADVCGCSARHGGGFSCATRPA